ncbi:hypothetical protein OQA88_8908 [Cercophora sp. LCS_1]
MCRPVSARWAPTPTAECIPPAKFMVYGYVYSAFTIASDLILSLLPITFILHLRRPLHEKVLIGCLMGAGLASTAVAVARLFLIMDYLGKSGPKINMVQDILWGFELTLGILAASVPTLKAPMHRHLMKWGVLRDESVLALPITAKQCSYGDGPSIIAHSGAPVGIEQVYENATEWTLRNNPSVIDPILAKSVAYLQSQGITKIATTGYCFGGRYAFRLLAAGKGVDAGFSAHPSLLEDGEILAVTKPISVAAAAEFSISLSIGCACYVPMLCLHAVRWFSAWAGV